MKTTRTTLWAGALTGLLYMIEAVVSTGLFFLLWPVLGGVFAAGLARRGAPRFSPGDGARAGAGAAVVGGVILLVVGTPVTLWLLRRLGEQPGFFGVRLDLGPVASLLVMFGGYAVLGVLVAALAGSVVGLFSSRRSSPTA